MVIDFRKIDQALIRLSFRTDGYGWKRYFINWSTFLRKANNNRTLIPFIVQLTNQISTTVYRGSKRQYPPYSERNFFFRWYFKQNMDCKFALTFQSNDVPFLPNISFHVLYYMSSILQTLHKRPFLKNIFRCRNIVIQINC